MSIKYIFNLNVVTNVGTVLSVIVITKDSKLTIPRNCTLQNIWNQVCFWCVIFTDYAITCSTSNVEVAKSSVLNTISFVSPSHDLFHHHLGFTIWVDWIKWGVFGYLQFLRNTISCST